MFEQTLPPGHLNFGISRVKLGRVLLREHRYHEAETESRTGLDILSKQASPSISWIQKGREGLDPRLTNRCINRKKRPGCERRWVQVRNPSLRCENDSRDKISNLVRVARI